MADLIDFFDRVYVINLRRRPDRLKSFQEQLDASNWPFRQPEVFAAIDGEKVPCPPEFKEGGGAFGCRQSHLGILQTCLMENVDSVLILEDDARLLPDFAEKVNKFLADVPRDWEGLYLGGQHINPPTTMKPGIVRATDVERTHAYGCRGRYLRALYTRWMFATEHIDWMMRSWQHQFRVYCPERFMIAQGRSKSDINGRDNGTQSWNPATGAEPVILLETSREVAEKLRLCGLHLGYHRDAKTGFDVGLHELVEATSNTLQDRGQRLSNWIRCIQAEADAEPGLICTVWHPDCDENLVKSATSAPVYVIKASTVEEALQQMPEQLTLQRRNSLPQQYVVVLRVSLNLLRELRAHGFHTGYWRDENDYDRGLVGIYKEQNLQHRQARLSDWVRLLQAEVEFIPNGKVAVWHPDAVVSELQKATDAIVMEIHASTVEETLTQFAVFAQQGISSK